MNDIKCGQALTYNEFFERFNAVSRGYHAFHSNLGPVKIVDSETGGMVAQLYDDLWIFFKQSAFDYDELDLMAKLAATSPEFRGGYSDDQN